MVDLRIDVIRSSCEDYALDASLIDVFKDLGTFAPDVFLELVVFLTACFNSFLSLFQCDIAVLKTLGKIYCNSMGHYVNICKCVQISDIPVVYKFSCIFHA